jgi:hypothetical protein
MDLNDLRAVGGHTTAVTGTDTGIAGSLPRCLEWLSV